MPNRHSVRFLLFFLLMVAALFFVGCSDDEEDTTSITDTGSLGGDGDIFVVTDPSELDVPWTMTMPGGGVINGKNGTQLKNRDEGSYSLSWPELPGWNSPRPSTEVGTLSGGSNLLFSAIYLPQPGTTQVKVFPDGLDAPWILESTNGLYVEATGDSTLTNLAPGFYRIIWSEMEGFATPDTVITSMSPPNPLYFYGVYGFDYDIVLVNPTPLELNAPWTLTGPGDFSLSGTGQTQVSLPADGDYTITWLNVDTYITPAPNAMSVKRGEELSFYLGAEYLPQPGVVVIGATVGETSMPWSLTGPNGGVQTGAGDATLSGQRPGLYSVQWDAVDGWLPGATEEIELPSGDGIYFGATAEAAITVRPLPADLYASWQLSGPSGVIDGFGEMLVSGLDAGSYTITWNSTPGWTPPASSSQTLAAGNGLVFEDSYTQISQTLHVNPTPASLDIPWGISGPLGFSESGTGMGSVALTEMGEYTITWGEFPGYMQPAPETLEYSGEGNLDFMASYQETLDLVQIHVGAFTMGSQQFESCRNGFEETHVVTLTRDYFLKSTEVTNAEFIAMAQWAFDRGYVTATQYGINDNLDGSTKELLDLDDGDQEIFFENGVFRCVNPDHPVKEVSWYGAASYCDWLSMYRGVERAYDHVSWVCGLNSPYETFGFRLPTETEWEYGCRAGTTNPFSNGTLYMGSYGVCVAPNLANIGWYDLSSEGWSHEVGLLNANSWGLYDMHGNVQEWCNDRFDEQYYFYLNIHGPLTNPFGPTFGDERVVRGGYFFSAAADCRSAARDSRFPSNASNDTGFRVALTSN